MAIEIERKFLVNGDAWQAQVESSVAMIQGYLAETESCSVRVRLAGDAASLNFKGLTIGARRTEFEYPVPAEDAEQMLDLYCGTRLIEKTRHYLRFHDRTWEIDEFSGANTGLVVAEVELDSEEQEFARPEWLGREVTQEPRYYNIRLVEHPYSEWKNG